MKLISEFWKEEDAVGVVEVILIYGRADRTRTNL